MADDLDAEFALFESEVAALESEAPAEGAVAKDDGGKAAEAVGATKSAGQAHPAAADAGFVKGGDGAAVPAAGNKRARVEYASAPVKRSVTQGFSPSVETAVPDTPEDIKKREEEKKKDERAAAAAPPNFGGSNQTPLGQGKGAFVSGGHMGGGSGASSSNAAGGMGNSFQPVFAPPPLPVPAMMSSSMPLSAPATAAPMAPPAGAIPGQPGYEEKKPVMRTAGGKKWEDASLDDWPKDDYRMFCGNLGNEVDDSTLARTFGKYPSFQKAKIVRDGRTKKPKGYGFVSFADPADFTKAMKEMNGKYVGNRPVKLMKSEHELRALEPGVKKEKPVKKEASEDAPWWKTKGPHKKKTPKPLK